MKIKISSTFRESTSHAAHVCVPSTQDTPIVHMVGTVDSDSATPREGDVDNDSEGGLMQSIKISLAAREHGLGCEDCLKIVVNFIV